MQHYNTAAREFAVAHKEHMIILLSLASLEEAAIQLMLYAYNYLSMYPILLQAIGTSR